MTDLDKRRMWSVKRDRRAVVVVVEEEEEEEEEREGVDEDGV